jgi:hypothetical protein
MPVFLTRANEEHFFIKRIDIFRYVIFREMPPVTRFFRFLNVVLDAAKKIVYYY